MASAQLSYLQLDPLGGWTSRRITVVVSLGVVAYAIAATAVTWRQVDSPLLALVALAAIASASGVVAHWSSPLRAPFPAAAFIAVLACGVLAMALSALASWQSNTSVRDDWAPLAVAVLVLLLSYYCRPVLVTGAAVGLGVSSAFIALLQSSHHDFAEPALAVVLMAASPPLAVALAGAGFSAVRARLLAEWRSENAALTEVGRGDLEHGLLRSVQEDRITILNRDVVPFLTGLLAGGTVGRHERERASAIAGSIRSLMVAEVDRTWLEAEVDRLGLARAGASWSECRPVRDPRRLANSMTNDQRTVVRALIGALFEHERFDPARFTLAITSHGTRCQVVLRAEIELGQALQRSELSMYLAVLRVLFLRLRVASEPPALTLKFSYEQ